MRGLCRLVPYGLLLMLAGPVLASEPIISGEVTEIADANTLRFADRDVRLAGVMPPPLARPEHGQARQLLRALTDGRYVWCLLIDDAPAPPSHGFCYVRGGMDLAGVLVGNGLGRDCPRYSGGRYYLMESKRARRSMDMPDTCF